MGCAFQYFIGDLDDGSGAAVVLDEGKRGGVIKEEWEVLHILDIGGSEGINRLGIVANYEDVVV